MYDQNSTPFNEVGFTTQIYCLFVAPALKSAAVYITLKHIMLCFSDGSSFLEARRNLYILDRADLLPFRLREAGESISL